MFKKILIYSITTIFFLIIGCGPSIRPMGNNTYMIDSVSPVGVSAANTAFHHAAKKACNNRSYDVINTQQSINVGSTTISGMVRCK